MKLRTWTLEQRLQQAQRIRQQKPWQHATGPRTPEGKAVSAKNSLKHGARSLEIREMARQVTELKRELHHLVNKQQVWQVDNVL